MKSAQTPEDKFFEKSILIKFIISEVKSIIIKIR
jgi:hypothetical protein